VILISARRELRRGDFARKSASLLCCAQDDY
jgi:hypothetical protein